MEVPNASKLHRRFLQDSSDKVRGWRIMSFALESDFLRGRMDSEVTDAEA